MKKIVIKMHGFNASKLALVDDEDYERIEKFGWHEDILGYARATASTAPPGTPYKEGKIRMHRTVMNAQKGQIVDHINGNKLDNRKSNLRFCTHAQNQQNKPKRGNNTSGFKGVFKSRKTWSAQITTNGKTLCLGSFDSPEKAGAAYRDAALKYHGEFANVC